MIAVRLKVLGPAPLDTSWCTNVKSAMKLVTGKHTSISAYHLNEIRKRIWQQGTRWGKANAEHMETRRPMASPLPQTQYPTCMHAKIGAMRLEMHARRFISLKLAILLQLVRASSGKIKDSPPMMIQRHRRDQLHFLVCFYVRVSNDPGCDFGG